MLLREFLTSKRRRVECAEQHRTEHRTYFFVAVDRDAQPELSQVFEKALCLVVGGPLPFPSCDTSSPFHITTLQFAVGETGSGSPMHFHQDAVNLLLNGRKRWWLQPPSLSAMSRLHPCLEREANEAAAWHYDTACVLEQEVGDVVYVPDMWGHAVLNLEPHTVCAAAEFA
eukprot:Skav225151  [mRNA]  locus=scaffold1056:273057:273569:- [translate_table: standard]